AFAKRGAGTCAKSPARNSNSLTGVVEDFGLKPEASITKVTVDDSILSCDSDGILDAEEKGLVSVTIKNIGTAALTKTTATVTSNIPGVTFPKGGMITFGNVDPFGNATGTVEVDADKSVMGMQPLTLTVALTDPDACTKTQNATLTAWINYDDSP